MQLFEKNTHAKEIPFGFSSIICAEKLASFSVAHKNECFFTFDILSFGNTFADICPNHFNWIALQAHVTSLVALGRIKTEIRNSMEI